MWTTVRLPLATSLVIFAVAVVLMRPARTTGLTDAEIARATKFVHDLESARPTGTPCTNPLLANDGIDCKAFGFADVDDDGVADCWRVEHREFGFPAGSFEIWPGCSDTRILLASDDTIIALPPEVAVGRWPRWIAAQLVGADVACADPAAILAGCRPPDDAWQWFLETSRRSYRRDGRGLGDGRVVHGLRAPQWSRDSLKTAERRALIVSDTPPGWQDEPGSGDVASGSGTHIVINGGRPGRASVSCGDVYVRATATGLLAIGTDETRGSDGYGVVTERDAWLLQLPGASDDLERLRCIDGLVFAYADSCRVVVVDPKSGGWMVYTPLACDVIGPHPYIEDDGEQRRLTGDYPLTALARWLATPTDARPALEALIPERHHAPARTVIDRFDESGPFRYDDDDDGDEHAVPADDLRAELSGHVTCGGWRLSWSRSAVLAERGAVSHWVIEDQGLVTGVRCEGRRAVISRNIPHDAIEPPSRVRDELVVDFEARTGAVRAVVDTPRD